MPANKIDKVVLDKVLKYLEKNALLDEENMRYFPGDYDFTSKEFQDLFYALEKNALYFTERSTKVGGFPEALAYFISGKTRFIWRLLIGQGSALQLWNADDCDFKFLKSKALKL